VAREMREVLENWYIRVIETIEEFKRKYGDG